MPSENFVITYKSFLFSNKVLYEIWALELPNVKDWIARTYKAPHPLTLTLFIQRQI